MIGTIPIEQQFPHQPLLPSPGNQGSVFCLMNLSIVDTHICGIIWYWSFCDWLISLSIMSLRVHPCCSIWCRIFFLKLRNSPFMYVLHFPISGHFGCCPYILAISTNAAMNVSVRISFWDPVFSSLGYIPKNGIAGS